MQYVFSFLIHFVFSICMCNILFTDIKYIIYVYYIYKICIIYIVFFYYR